VRVAISLISFFLSCITANASSFYVATTGDDGHDCLSKHAPCLTIQGAVSKIPIATVGYIEVARGTYAEAVDVFYYRLVNIRGDGADPGSVIVQPTGKGGTVFWAHHAILFISCLTIGSSHTGTSELRHANLLSLTSVASCTGPYFIDNGANVRATISALSRRSGLNRAQAY
jgi:hypothetical protein